MFFPQATFDGKDKSKIQTYLQSFENFVDRQKTQSRKRLKVNSKVFSDDTLRFS